MDREKATTDFLTWLRTYAERILSERDEWAAADFDAEREKAAKSANPRFVLRQWVLEEVIKKVENDTGTGKKILAKVLQVSFLSFPGSFADARSVQMACNPFEPWGAEGDERPDEELDAEIKEEKRYCGMGEKAMLGFQCSCSS